MRVMPRSIAIILALTLLALPSFAAEVLKPEDYLAIVGKSKLRYNILSEPSKTPVEELTCPRRDERTRLVVDGKEKKLVAWQVAPAALKLLLEGEEHYDAQRMDEAAAKYKAAIATDPQALMAYFFLGDALLFGANDAEGALAQYRKGIALDPSIPTGHFFAASAYTQLGRLKEAREEIVQALIVYPGYEKVWKIGTQNPDYWDVKPMVRHPFEPPTGYLGRKGKNGIDVGIDVFGGKDGEWLGYALCKAAWANEPQFDGKRGGSGSWSLEEERACVINQLTSTLNATDARLRKEQKTSIAENDVIAALPARERYLFDVAGADLLDGYILFEIIGQRCPIGMSLLNDDARRELEKYIRAYVVVANAR